MSVLEDLAAFATRHRGVELDRATATSMKHCLLDTVACVAYGLDEEATQASIVGLQRLNGTGRARVFGSDLTMLPGYAVLSNGVAIRSTEYNDTYVTATTMHPSELTPVALAVGEDVGASGRDVLVALATGYEAMMRLADRVNLTAHGWHHTTLGMLAAPVVAGMLLDLEEAELAEALAISASYGLTPNEMHFGGLSMMRNVAFPFANSTAITSCLLARGGFTGPDQAVVGRAGYLAQLGEETSSFDGLFEDDALRVDQVTIKQYGCSTTSQSAVAATLELAREHHLGAGDVESVHVRTFRKAFESGADPKRRTPEHRESADHSLYYSVAVSLLDGDVGPAQYEMSRILSSDVRELIERITIEHDPTLDEHWPGRRPAVISIVTTDGRTLETRVDSPLGDPLNPMTLDQLMDKYLRLTARRFTEKEAHEIADLVLNLETLTDVGLLTERLARS
jgi:2-methylcitrate dehydratase